MADHGHPRRIDEIQLRQITQRRVGVERLIREPAAAAAGDAARAEAVDRKTHITPRAQFIGYLRRVAGEAAAAMQHDNRRIGLGAVGIAAEQRRQAGVRPREIPAQLGRRLLRDAGEFDQTSGTAGRRAE